jgi:ABC-2 type transport system ATP-binding protein
MDEAEHLADRVVVIDRGRVVAEGTPAQLAARGGARTVVSFRLPPGVAAEELPALAGAVRPSGAAVDVLTPDPTGDVHALTAWALARGVALEELALARPSLEDVYLELVEQPVEEPVEEPDHA